MSANPKTIEITGLMLRSEETYVIVEVEIDGEWYQIIKEFSGTIKTPFSRIIEPAGIRRAIEEAMERQPKACQCERPFLPIGGWGCELCGGTVSLEKLPAYQSHCGHPTDCIVATNGGTNHCAECEAEARR